jgi:CheY-like chemotaxis protein
MLKMRLELLSDFEVLTATDGEKGCEMALSDRPDIILMDLEMTVVDGWEATRRLKGNPQTRDIPVIVLSAHALAGEREKAIGRWVRRRPRRQEMRAYLTAAAEPGGLAKGSVGLLPTPYPGQLLRPGDQIKLSRR